MELWLTLGAVVCWKWADLIKHNKHSGTVLRTFTKTLLSVCSCNSLLRRSAPVRGSLKMRAEVIFLAKPETVSTKTKGAEENSRWNKHLRKYQRFFFFQLFSQILFFVGRMAERETRDLSAAASRGFMFWGFLANIIFCLWEFAEVSLCNKDPVLLYRMPQ